jgi:uncharacterized repeat protein (TIGR01451 family)
VGNSVSVILVVRVNGSGNIENNANVSANETNVGNNSTGGNNSTITTPEIVNLTITKISNVTGNASFGDYVLYTIVVTNHGPDNATGVLITDVLDSRLIYVNSSATVSSYNPVTGLWLVGALGVNENATLYITVRINGTGDIVNVANVTTTSRDIGNNSTTGNDTNFSVPPTVNLTITKSVNVTGNVGQGQLVTYTIVVTNHGPDNATGLSVTDLLDSRLVYVNSSATVSSYDPSTGLWNIGNLSVGQSETLYIIVRINGTGNIMNIANATVNQFNIGNNGTNGNGTNLNVLGTANFTITKTSNATGRLNIGDLVTYTIVVTNHGPDNATNVRVTDVLDPRLVYLSSSGTVGTYDPVTGLWYIGNLDVGQTVTLKINVRVNGSGNIINVANISSDQINIGNSSTGNNSTNLTVVGTVNITITKTCNVTGNVNVGDYVMYTIVVTNHGPDNATGLRVIDILDPRLIFISSNATQGTYNPTTGLWTVGNLDAGQTVILYITVKVNGTGNIVNFARLTVDQNNIGETNCSDGAGINATVLGVSDDEEEEEIFYGDDDEEEILGVSDDDLGITAGANSDLVSMKKTGMPINAIVLIVLLLSLLVFTQLKRKRLT